VAESSRSDQDHLKREDRPVSRRASGVLLIGVLLLALALRLWGLDAKGLWQDEIFTAAIASPQNSLAEVVSIPLYNTALPAPPLYFLVTHFLLRLGDSDFVLRFPALVFGILGVVATYPLGARIFGRVEGVAGALFVAVAPFHVRYSQDARFYTLLVFLSLVSVYALYRAVQHRGRAWFIIFTVASTLNVYNHLFAFLVLGAEVVFVLGLWVAGSAARAGSRRGSEGTAEDSLTSVGKRELLAFAISLAIIALAYAPMVPHLWRGLSGTKGLGDGGAGLTLDAVPLFQALDSWGLGSGWRILILLPPFVLGAVASARAERRALWLLCCWTLVPFAVLLVQAGHGFRPRYVLFVLPLYLLFAAKGLTATASMLGQRLGRGSSVQRLGTVAGLVMLIALLTAPSLQAYYEEDRADWRSVSSLVASQIVPGDVIVSPGPFPRVVMPRYERSLEEATFVIGGSEAFMAREEGAGGVWFVGPAREKMEAIDAEITQSVGFFFKLVFEVDDTTVVRGRALKIAPVMYDDLWVLYLREGLAPQEVVQRYRRALEVVPDSVAASISVTLGDWHRSEEQFEEAIAEYRQAAALNPRAPGPHYGLALVYEAQGLQEQYEMEWRLYEELSVG